MPGLEGLSWQNLRRLIAEGRTLPQIAAKKKVTVAQLEAFIAGEKRRQAANREANGKLPPDRMPVARLKKPAGWDFSGDNLDPRD